MAGVGWSDEILGVHAAAVGVLQAVGVLAFGAVGASTTASDCTHTDALALCEIGDIGAQFCDDAGPFVPRIAAFHSVAAVDLELAAAEGGYLGCDKHFIGTWLGDWKLDLGESRLAL